MQIAASISPNVNGPAAIRALEPAKTNTDSVTKIEQSGSRLQQPIDRGAPASQATDLPSEQRVTGALQTQSPQLAVPVRTEPAPALSTNAKGINQYQQAAQETSPQLRERTGLMGVDVYV